MTRVNRPRAMLPGRPMPAHSRTHQRAWFLALRPSPPRRCQRVAWRPDYLTAGLLPRLAKAGLHVDRRPTSTSKVHAAWRDVGIDDAKALGRQHLDSRDVVAVGGREEYHFERIFPHEPEDVGDNGRVDAFLDFPIHGVTAVRACCDRLVAGGAYRRVAGHPLDERHTLAREPVEDVPGEVARPSLDLACRISRDVDRCVCPRTSEPIRPPLRLGRSTRERWLTSRGDNQRRS